MGSVGTMNTNGGSNESYNDSPFKATTEKVNKLINNIENLNDSYRLTPAKQKKLNEYINTAKEVLDFYDMKTEDRRRLIEVLKEIRY